jgi:FkbH-like protein
MLESLLPPAIAARRSRGTELLVRPAAAEATRVTVLSTFNIDLLPPFLAEALERAGQPPAGIRVTAFGQLAQQFLLPDSRLYRDAPDVVVLVVAAEDLLEPLFALAPSQLPAAKASELVATRVQELRCWLGLALERLPAAMFYVGLVGPVAAPLEHVLEPLAPERGQIFMARLSEEMLALSGLGERVVVLDWEWHTRSLDVGSFHDPRLWYLARMRLNPGGLAALAELIACHVAGVRGALCKVLAVDLDGVMWGGVVGEAGLRGIELGEEGVGLAFQDFQRELLRIRDCGVLLALCSKNNPRDVSEVLERHPAMVLRHEHFAAERANWQDKATNLRELALELAVGIDTFMYLDDSPIEREWVRRALPEVAVPELPEDPVERPAMLRACPDFKLIALTDADRGRAGAYRAERHRRAVSATATSFEVFLASLEQQVTIEPVSDASLSRAAQLCQRTNQFNLTTRRYDAAQLGRMLDDDDVELYTLAVSDRFGDSGITGLAILRHAGDEVEIDTFLMSCRILGWRLEDALLAFLAERAGARGARVLVGRFEPTPKNGQAADFYRERDFEPADGGSFRLDLTVRRLTSPPHVQIEVIADA